MAKKHYVMANWKMNLLAQEGLALANDVLSYVNDDAKHVQTILCPPSLMLSQIADAVGSKIAIGAQDCHAEISGAFTGNVSAPMVKDAGADYVLVGHSERRQYHAESDEIVANKSLAAIAAGLVPVICVGEHLFERESGRAIDVVVAQVLGSVPEGIKAPFLLAYEPVWAIGTGKVPTINDIEAMHEALRDVLITKRGVASEDAHVLYGGSVKASNANEIFALPSVGGVLVGGASLKAEEFGAILKAAS